MNHQTWVAWMGCAFLALANMAYGQGDSSLKFKDAGQGLFTFDTGVARGQLSANDRQIGITSLTIKGSDANLADDHVGVISHYRLFSGPKRFGNAAREWPKSTRLFEDGAVEVTFNTDSHPFTIKAIYRWVAADTLDVRTSILPAKDLPQFELFVGSYFARDTRGFVYVQPNQFEQGSARLVPVDVNSMIDGAYMMFPRDQQAARMVYDGRWDQPPHPVRWATPRWNAGPLTVRRSASGDLAVAVMSQPDQCFAVACPYNKTPPDGPSGHASLYHSLFGGDLKSGHTAWAHMRVIVGKDLTDEQIIGRYLEYVQNRDGRQTTSASSWEG